MAAWGDEPDARLWRTQAGLHAAVLRMPELRHLCGYVRVPDDSPLYGLGCDDLSDVEVHGGLTFAGRPAHVKMPKRTWWFGFDCAHVGDLVPGAQGDLLGNGTYRDMTYVTAECARLAAQLRELDDERR